MSFDFGWLSVSFRNRGRSKKTAGCRALESRGSSLALGSYLQRGSVPRGLLTL